MNNSLIINKLPLGGGKILLLAAILALASCSKDPLTENESVSAPDAVEQDEGSGSTGTASESGSEGSGQERIPVQDRDKLDEGIEWVENSNVDLSQYDPEKYLLSFAADIKTADEQGKTSLVFDKDGVVKATWSDGDCIKVVTYDGSKAAVFNWSEGKFKWKEGDILPAGQTYYACYPASIYKSVSGTKFTVDLTQATRYGYLGPNGDRSFTISNNANAPLACKFSGKSIASFTALSNILAVQAYGVETIKALQLYCNGQGISTGGTIEFSGSKPVLSDNASGALDITMSPATPQTLNASTPVNFYFILPPGRTLSASAMEFRTTFKQVLDEIEYNPVLTLKPSGDITTQADRLYRIKLHAHFFSGGLGTSGDPYIIKTADDLTALKTRVNNAEMSNSTDNNTPFRSAYYKQTATISYTNASDVDVIGVQTHYFIGDYNGNSQSINYGSDATKAHRAIFGYIGGDGCIHDLNVNANMTSGTDYCGGIAIIVTGNASIENCNVSGSIESNNSYVGGIVGRMTSGSVSGCTFNGTLSGTSNVGGIIGIADESGSKTISGCLVANTANTVISGSVDCVGGIAGFAGDNSSFSGCKVANVDNTCTATISAGGDCAGGIVGDAQGSSISIAGSYVGVSSTKGVTYKFTVSTTGDNAGGLAGSMAGTIGQCPVRYGNISANANVGGVVGKMTAGSITPGNDNSALVYRCKIEGTAAGETNVGGIVGLVKDMTANVTINGKGTASDHNIITTLNESNYYIKGEKFVGGIVGYQHSGSTGYKMTIGSDSNQIFVNDIRLISDWATGGVCGFCNNAAISYCTTHGELAYSIHTSSVNNSIALGGIAGKVNGGTTISNCTNKTAIDAGEYDYAGGIVGQITKTANVSRCTNEGAISGGDNIGGIVGGLYTDNAAGTEISSCTNNANITGYYNLGGILGQSSVSGTISGCSTQGTSTTRIAITSLLDSESADADLGGIAGECGMTINDCSVKYCNISVTKGNRAGGMVGCLVSGGLIDTNNTSTPVQDCDITAFNKAGGICGEQNALVRFKSGSNITLHINVTAKGSYAGGVSGYSTAKIGDTGGYGGTAEGGLNSDETAVQYTIRAYTSHAGGIAGYTRSEIYSVRTINLNIKVLGADGTTYGDYVGGIAGELAGTESSFKGASSYYGAVMASIIEGNDFVGGITGKSKGSIQGTTGSQTTYWTIQSGLRNPSSPSEGDATIATKISGHDYVGGIVGYCEGNVSKCSIGKNNDIARKLPVTIEGRNWSGSYIGGIAGYLDGEKSVTDCNVDKAEIRGGANIGGIAGYVNNGTIGASNAKCLADGITVTTSEGTYKRCGGITSSLKKGTVQYCNVTNSTLTTETNCAGIASVVGQDGSGPCTVQYCKVSDCIIGANSSTTQAGGIVAFLANGTVDHCYGYNNTVQGKNFIGGAVGYIPNAGTSALINSAVIKGTIQITPGTTEDSHIGGLVGYASANSKEVIIANCCAAANRVKSNVKYNRAFVGGAFGRAFDATVQNLYCPMTTLYMDDIQVSASGATSYYMGAIFGHTNSNVTYGYYHSGTDSGRGAGSIASGYTVSKNSYDTNHLLMGKTYTDYYKKPGTSSPTYNTIQDVLTGGKPSITGYSFSDWELTAQIGDYYYAIPKGLKDL